MGNTKSAITSVLDRLLDFMPGQTDDRRYLANQTVSELCLSVRRDLENMLNTRSRAVTWDKDLKELTDSLLNYGIPDFTGVQLSSKQLQQEFCVKLEKLIRQYEPRFKQVSVTLSNQFNTTDRVLRLQIDGLLYAEPVAQPVVFDFELEPEAHKFQSDGYLEW